MKAFYLLISCLLASIAFAEEEQWYDAEGNVVRVFSKGQSAAQLEKKEPLFKDVYQWGGRRTWRSPHVRGHAVYANSRYRCGSWPNYYSRSYYRNGSYSQSYCRPTGYRGTSLNFMINR